MNTFCVYCVNIIWRRGDFLTKVPSEKAHMARVKTNITINNQSETC